MFHTILKLLSPFGFKITNKHKICGNMKKIKYNELYGNNDFIKKEKVKESSRDKSYCSHI